MKQNKITINDIFFKLNNEPNISITKADVYQIIEFLLNMEYNQIIINLDQEIDQDIYDQTNEIIESLKEGKPIAHILGYKHFQNNKILVNENVLIPREESSILIEKATIFLNKNLNCKVLDLCTGSGVLGLSLKHKFKSIDITLADISENALEVAKKNFENYNILDANFILGDFIKPLKEKYNLIICNPPYIDINDPNVEESVKNFEPSIALFAEENGLYFYEELFKNFDKILDTKNEYMLVCEFGWKQKEEINKIFNKYLSNEILNFQRDINGNWRSFTIEGDSENVK